MLEEIQKLDVKQLRNQKMKSEKLYLMPTWSLLLLEWVAEQVEVFASDGGQHFGLRKVEVEFIVGSGGCGAQQCTATSTSPPGSWAERAASTISTSPRRATSGSTARCVP